MTTAQKNAPKAWRINSEGDDVSEGALEVLVLGERYLISGIKNSEKIVALSTQIHILLLKYSIALLPTLPPP